MAEFLFSKMPAGRFVEPETYPTAPGRYRYMPFRGIGHLRLQEEVRLRGAARCSFVSGEAEFEFTCTTDSEYGILEILEVLPPAKLP